jgi:putative membrane protein
MFHRATLTAAAFAVLATGGIALAASSSVSSAASAPTDAEKQFLTTVIQGDNSEIALGGLALGRGSTVALRDYGFMLITDHRKNKITAEDLAAKLGVTPPLDISPDAQAEAKKLLGLSGAAFDQEFASFMVADHTKVIAMFKAQAGNKDDVGAFATKSLPVLEKHLKTAQSLESGPTSSSASSAPAASSASAPASSSAM